MPPLMPRRRSTAGTRQRTDSVSSQSPRQPGVWSAEPRKTSLTFYEASGLCLWLKTGIDDTTVDCDSDVNWQSLVKFNNTWFGARAAFKAEVTQKHGDKKRKCTQGRLLWPCEMIVGISCIKEVAGDHFEGTLPLLVNGKFIIWSWFLALFEAMQANAPRLLVSCCLSAWQAASQGYPLAGPAVGCWIVSHSVRLCQSEKARAMASNCQMRPSRHLATSPCPTPSPSSPHRHRSRRCRSAARRMASTVASSTMAARIAQRCTRRQRA